MQWNVWGTGNSEWVHLYFSATTFTTRVVLLSLIEITVHSLFGQYFGDKKAFLPDPEMVLH